MKTFKPLHFCCILLLSVLTFQACKVMQTTGGYYTYQTECLGTELDGSFTVRGWGSGRNQVAALEQARKNAVRDVIFNGVSKGKSGCEIKPLLLEPNAQEKYRDYFYKFFANGGEYEKFVSKKSSRTSTYHRERTEDQIKYGVTIRIMYEDLRNQLIKDGILKTN